MGKQTLFCKTTVLNMLRKHEPLFSGWRVTAFLGSGVSGCVYKMKREDLGQEFTAALKVIALTRQLDEHTRSMDSLQQSIGQDAREIIHLYNLGTHQNLVGLYNHEIFHAYEKDTITALVCVLMEYLPQTLGETIKKGPLPWRDALQMLIGCLRGLEHVHNKGIIHRDIKPVNIFVSEDGHPKIGDFGVARKLAEHAQAETRVGTPLYIAPEVLRDPYSKRGYTHLVDVYSIALVGYELITGYLPFHETCQGNKSCMVQKRLAGEPIFMPKGLPPGLTQALLGGLAVRPNQRYRSAADFREALETVLRTDGKETIKPPSVQQPAQQGGQQAQSQTISASQPAASPASEEASKEEDLRFSPPPKKQEESSSVQAKISHDALGGDYYDPNAYQESPVAQMLDALSSARFNKMLTSPFGVLLAAGGACAASLFMRDDIVLFPLIFFFSYIILPTYMILAGPAMCIFSSIAFFLSLLAYNYLYTETLLGFIDETSLTILGLYAISSILSHWLRKK